MLKQVRLALLTCCVLASAGLAFAGDCCPAPCAPCYKTVCCTEWVCESYPCTRTVYKPVCKEECYTAYKCECVPEVRTRTFNVCKAVPEVCDVVRNYCVCVPCCEERVVMEKHYVCKPVTKIVRKCEDRGHWECREVCCKPSFFDRLRNRGCCDCCPKTKIEKCWVPCPVWIDCPVTCMVRTCEYRPCTIKVTTYKKEMRQEVCKVTRCRYVTECRTENYTVLCQKLVPFQATRKVTVCVPVQETYTATRMVPRTVVKQIPCGNGCCY